MKINEQKSGDICCGGIIIWLITKSHLSLVIPQDTSIAEGSIRLDLDSLERVNMIRPKVEGRYTWLHGRHRESLGTLLDPQRTQVSPTTDWSFPDHVAATAGASQVEQHHLSHSQILARFDVIDEYNRIQAEGGL